MSIWRPQDWKNPFNKSPIEANAFEDGADAMLAAIRKKLGFVVIDGETMKYEAKPKSSP